MRPVCLIAWTSRLPWRRRDVKPLAGVQAEAGKAFFAQNSSKHRANRGSRQAARAVPGMQRWRRHAVAQSHSPETLGTALSVRRLSERRGLCALCAGLCAGSELWSRPGRQGRLMGVLLSLSSCRDWDLGGLVLRGTPGLCQWKDVGETSFAWVLLWVWLPLHGCLAWLGLFVFYSLVDIQ